MTTHNASDEAKQAVGVHVFFSSEEAYGASQCLDEIQDGDVLYVPTEGIVGILVGAWPVAVTDQAGEFHPLHESITDQAAYWASQSGGQYEESFRVALAVIPPVMDAPAESAAVLYYQSPGTRVPLSVQRQTADARQYCAAYGWSLIGEFHDHGQLPKADVRPSWADFVFTVAAGAVGLAVLDRKPVDINEWIGLTKACALHDVALYVADGDRNYQLTGNFGRYLEITTERAVGDVTAAEPPGDGGKNRASSNGPLTACPYACGFDGTPSDVDDHVTYLVSMGDADHQTLPGSARGGRA
ncbi:hypothetical protein [Kutzneria chonburiensis]|uniref:JAB domain-containing protein n=1 Tax=Kutzneria chonburiensis TaxID=1483604 RepID=A0ABV6N2Y3_9PSEU